MIEDIVTEMLANNKTISNSWKVQNAVQEQSGQEVTNQLVRQMMRKDLRLGYRKARTVTIQSNSERCLV